MKKLLLFMLVGFIFFASCSSLNQLKRFSKCDFDLKRVEDLRIANIDVSNVKSYSDFTYVDVAKLTEAFLKKELPLSLTFVMEITNNSRRTATLEKLDYIVSVDNKVVATGSVTERIEVAPRGVPSLYYVKTELDIVNLFEKEDLRENVLLALRLISSDNIYNEIELKVKPYIRSGNQFIATPNYFKVKREK